MSMACIQFVSPGNGYFKTSTGVEEEIKKVVGREYCTIRTTLEAQMLKEDMVMMVAMATMDDG
jgi:hypothetical protein